MRNIAAFVFVIFTFAFGACAQHKPNTAAPTKPSVVPAKTAADKGTVDGRTYTNPTLGFTVTFPDTWLIPGDDFEDEMRKQGFDLGLKAPANLSPAAKAAVNRSLRNVTILMTAYRSMPGTKDNAIARISVEDLSSQTQIKDAVDYCDAVRATYRAMRLPADFKYSETQAEKLGAKQFAFLDTASSAGKKRMYVTVRKDRAMLFKLSYSEAADLETMRQVLAGGDFSLK